MLEPDPENPSRRLPVLKQYFSGIQVIKKLDIKLVWPGHGGVFNNVQNVIKAGYTHRQEQCEKIKKVLGKEQKNCYQVTKTVYSSLKGWDIFMGVSEIQAHLDYLFDNGELGGEINGGVMYYWNTGR